MADQRPKEKAFYTAREFRGSLMAMGTAIGGLMGATQALIIRGKEGTIDAELLEKVERWYRQSVKVLERLLGPEFAEKIKQSKADQF